MSAFHNLGIDGLPATAAALHGGGIYLISVSSRPLIQSLLFANLPSCDGAPLLCATRQGPAHGQDTTALDRRLDDRTMALLTPRERRGGSGKLLACLRELGQHRPLLHPEQGGLTLALDHAEHWLPLDNPQQAERLLDAAGRWAARDGHAVLLLLNTRHLGAAELPLLSRLARHCAGLARADQVDDTRFSWQISHWQGASRTVCADIYPLERNAAGALTLPQAQHPAEPAQPADAADLDTVLTTHACLSGFAPPSDDWQLFDDTEALLAAALQAVGATVLLDTASLKREALGPTVHKLRLGCGSRLKIVVRELGNRRLRQSEEQVLLRLGANAVLPAEMRFASVVGVVRALRQAVFRQSSNMGVDALRDAGRPLDDRGYLPPPRFVEAVSRTVERSRTVNIGNVLIRLTPAAGATPLDLLKLGRFQRSGDLCTADRQSAYLFLFGCRPSDADAALNHMFRMAIGEVAEADVRSHDAESILLALAQLTGQPGFAALPDLSPQFAVAGAEVTPAVAAQHSPARLAAPVRAPLSRQRR